MKFHPLREGDRCIEFVPHEAHSITPVVANNPAMSHFYRHPAGYKAQLTHEGELVLIKRA